MQVNNQHFYLLSITPIFIVEGKRTHNGTGLMEEISCKWREGRGNVL